MKPFVQALAAGLALASALGTAHATQSTGTGIGVVIKPTAQERSHPADTAPPKTRPVPASKETTAHAPTRGH